MRGKGDEAVERMCFPHEKRRLALLWLAKHKVSSSTSKNAWLFVCEVTKSEQQNVGFLINVKGGNFVV